MAEVGLALVGTCLECCRKLLEMETGHDEMGEVGAEAGPNSAALAWAWADGMHSAEVDLAGADRPEADLAEEGPVEVDLAEVEACLFDRMG